MGTGSCRDWTCHEEAVGGIARAPGGTQVIETFPEAIVMSEPTVSVCIPTFRGASTLGRAIESVLAQSYADFELLVIDDNSPDDTAAVVGRYRDGRLRYLRNADNLGPEANWNRCLAESRGKYIKLLPHDDLLARLCLERQVAVLHADPKEELALVFCARDVVLADDRTVMRRGYRTKVEGAVAGETLQLQCIKSGTNLIGEPGAVMFRRSLARKVGGFDGAYPYVIDLDYWFRLLDHGAGYYLPEALAKFRVSRQQWSVALSRQQRSDLNGLVQRALAKKKLKLSPLGHTQRMVMPAINTGARMLFYRLLAR